MRVITYADPFRLKENTEVWKLITSHPHYCASDTLVQGMIRYYGRESFSVIRPLQDLLETYMDLYTKNPVNDMNLYLEVVNAIRSWPDSPLKQSFLFNKSHVVDAIRVLMPLGFDPEKVDKALLSEEQRKLIEIYNTVIQSDCNSVFKSLQRKNERDFQEAIRSTATREIRYQISNNEVIINKLANRGINVHNWTIGQAKDAAQIAIQELEETPGSSRKITALHAAINACSLKPDTYYSTVIIHGIHRFTPVIVYLLKNLDQVLKINIIFLIPYADGLPAVYNTWKRVYEWVHADFENVSSLSPSYQPEADEMAQVLSGEKLSEGKKRELQKFDNLTTFSLHEVGPAYERTIDKKHGNVGNLDKMKKQFYAVKGRECNELLKMFYPDQFRNKPFLSYPIGQLILGIYRMWDFDREEILFSVDTLVECAASGVFQNGENVAKVLRKTKLFFHGAQTYQEYYNRIQIIRRFIREEPSNPHLSGLKHLSFLNITSSECLAMETFLTSLRDTAIKLFAGKTRGQINYVQHFNKLMDIISDAANSDNRVLQDAERELIGEIKTQLNTGAREPVLGSLHDVSDALAFFLSSRIDKNTSNWIVRDFEQIDGAVLLSKTTEAQKYHFALLSNEHMLKQNQDELPWPLTVDVFDKYEEKKDEVLAIASSVRERRSFLKFILFYGTHYSHKEIEFSYVAEEDDEQQSPYYLFTAMGYEPKQIIPEPIMGFMMNDEEQKKKHIDIICDRDSKELFAICPFKFFINKVLGADIEYSSEYHVTYFLRYYLTYLGRELKMKDSYAAVTKALEGIRIYFPFLGQASFTDLVRDAGADLDYYKTYIEIVHHRKMNFLVAGWKGDWHPVFKLLNPEKEISNYLNSDVIYPEKPKLPKHTFCDYCNYASICLRDFYMDHEMETEEMENIE